jgi:CheY-like chemotaxis protein
MISDKEPIIFLDDDTDDHFIFTEICKKIGVQNQLKFFKHGEDLLDYLKTTADKPFIIFCDINMPQMSGLKVRKNINDDKHLREKSIPFVFFSTAASPEQIKEAYNLTVQGFFIKEPTFVETEETFRLILKYWQKCKHPNSSR